MSCFVATGICRADMLSANFTVDNGSPSATSGGMVTFTLNADGTIAASVVSFGTDIYGLGFDSPGGKYWSYYVVGLLARWRISRFIDWGPIRQPGLGVLLHNL
jgi:hypothetical protein